MWQTLFDGLVKTLSCNLVCTSQFLSNDIEVGFLWLVDAFDYFIVHGADIKRYSGIT